jgi:hypothetical protein
MGRRSGGVRRWPSDSSALPKIECAVARVGVDAHGAAPNVFEILTHEFGAVDLDDPWSGMIAVRYGTAPGPSIE